MSINRKPWSGYASLATALIALLAVGCGGTGSAAGDDPRSVAGRFLDELRAGSLEPAWQKSSVEFKSLMGLGSLKDYVKRHPALKAPAEYSESRAIDRDGHAMTECLFRGTSRVRNKPVPATIKVLLAAGDDGWKVEQLAVE